MRPKAGLGPSAACLAAAALVACGAVPPPGAGLPAAVSGLPAAAAAASPGLAASGAAPAPAPSTLPATPAAAPAASPPGIPVLMYHVVAVAAPGAPYPGLYVTPALFAAQVGALAGAGYQAITLLDAYDIWQGREPAPPHPVVFSFDDGYAGVAENAEPVLRARGWPAVLNLEWSRLGVPGGLSADQVRHMIADGWEIDDHTLTHPDLTRVPSARLQQEIVGAAVEIRSTFGVPVNFFCYPAGRYDPQVVAAVRAAGFLGATTTWPGVADPGTDGWWTLDRVRVDGGESPAALLAALAAAARQKPSAPPAFFPPPSAPAALPPALYGASAAKVPLAAAPATGAGAGDSASAARPGGGTSPG